MQTDGILTLSLVRAYLDSHQVSNKMSDNTATVTVTLPRDWLQNNHLDLDNTNNQRLSLIVDHQTKPLVLFTQWREHSYEPLPYTVVDTDEAENRTQLLRTVILELEHKINRLVRPGFAGEEAPLDDASVSEGWSGMRSTGPDRGCRGLRTWLAFMS